MNKKELIAVYIVGGVIFVFLRIFCGLFLFGLFHYQHDLAEALNVIVEILFLAFISNKLCNFTPLIYLFVFLQGGALSMLVFYGYYNCKVNKEVVPVNPISKKALFISVAMFVGYVLFTALIF